MSLFDSLGKGVTETQTGGDKQQNSLIAAAAQMISSGNIGGLSGLVQLFNQHGYGDKLNSWVSTGENKPISPEEVQDALGKDRVREIADRAGVSEEEASSGLSNALPQLVDRLTPNGQLPDDSSMSSTLSRLASRFLKH